MGKKPQIEILQRSIRAYVICIFFFLAMNAVIGMLLCFGPLPEKWTAYYMLFALVTACFLIGMMAGSILQKRGLIYGVCYAAILLLIILLSVFAATGGENPIGLMKLPYLICLFFGGIGGIMGVNQRN